MFFNSLIDFNTMRNMSKESLINKKQDNKNASIN